MNDQPSKTPRFFYGYVMLPVAVIMALATMPSQTIIVSLFNDTFREQHDLSVSELSMLYTVGTIMAAFPLSWIGRCADRYGLRIVTACIIAAYAVALAALPHMPGPILLGFGFFTIRLLGQGSLGMLSGHVIAMWFERRLGVAHSILAVGGFAGGSMLLPKPIAWMIEQYGASKTLFILACIVALVMGPILLFIFRNKPEDIGQHLDGDPVEHEPHDTTHGGPPPPGDPGFTLAQARRTSAFWILLVLACTSGCIGTALLYHMQEMIRSGGAEGTLAQATSANQAWAVTFGLGMLATGWLADRFKPRVLLPIAPVLMLVGSLMSWYGASGRAEPDQIVSVMTFAMAVYGLGMAIAVAVGGPAVARYFGRTHHGSIRGFKNAFGVAATGIAPLLVGKWYELAGNDFGPPLIGFVIWCVPLTIATMFLTRPEPPAQPDTTPDPDPVDMQDVEL